MQELRVVDEFWSDLRALWEKAGRPSMRRLEHLGQEQRPAIKVAGTTIDGWLTGKAVPGAESTAFFRALVAELLSRAGEEQVGRSVDAWMHRLRRAQAERKANQGRVRPKPAPAPQLTEGPRAPAVTSAKDHFHHTMSKLARVEPRSDPTCRECVDRFGMGDAIQLPCVGG